jgi:predicted ribonuclease YlaK
MGKPRVKFQAEDNVKEIGVRKRFTPKDLKAFTPKTKKQAQFLDAFYSQVPIILQVGSAGTGKSMVALYAALSEVFDAATPYEKVVIVRSAVETRAIGFLPGFLEEKTEPFERPFVDLVERLINYSDPKKTYNNLKSLGYLEFMLTTHIRGLTFDNCIYVIEEAQNCDQQEILSVLTRVGDNSKIVICGDSKQDDLFRQKFKSGFSYLQQLATNMRPGYIETIEYTIDDIVRSGLVKEILIADSKIS